MTIYGYEYHHIRSEPDHPLLTLLLVMFVSWICKHSRGLSWKQHKAPPVFVWPWNQNKLCHTVHSANAKLPNRCLSSSGMVSLCSVAASNFRMPCSSIFTSSKSLLTFNSLSELVLQAANACFLCITARADVLLDVEKYLPFSSSDSAVKFLRTSAGRAQTT